MIRSDTRGFTLLEVLSAIAILGIVLLTLTQGMRFGTQAWHAQTSDDAWNEEMQGVDRLLRQMIEKATGGEWLNDRGPILGSARVLDLVTILPPYPGALPDTTIEGKLDVDAAGHLVLRWVPRVHATWMGPPPVPSVVTLLSGLRGLEVSYWRAAPGGGGTWLREWTVPDPPAMVRLRLVFPPGGARHWPDIIAAPRTGRPHALEMAGVHAGLA